MLGRFEPSAPIETEFVDLDDGDKQLIVLRVSSQADARPFAFDGRAYQRVQSTTSVMPQDRYQAMLLERAQARHRWENMPAVGVTLADLDHEEILRTRDAAIRQRRTSAGTSTDVADIPERLGLLRDGVLTQAARVLYGTRFLPDYPQGMLKLGRFRGAKITGDILDNRQEHLHAFDMVREAMAWLDRTLPLAAHFPPGEIFREDRLPVPAEALREIILNAVMHRDYTQPGSYVAIAVFDDRIEVRSIGGLPRGVSAESLAAEHRSVLRNPLIAEAFHRTGAVEVWGRGVNRVIEACERYGIEAPVFDERSGAVFVTFGAQIRANADLGHDMGRHGTKSGPSPCARYCHRSAAHQGTDGALRRTEPHQVQGPGRRTAARYRTARDDHPRQAQEFEAALPHDSRGQGKDEGVQTPGKDEGAQTPARGEMSGGE